MKNQRYLDKALENLGLDPTIAVTVLDVYSECQRVAIESSETIDFDVESDILFELYSRAHAKDITFNELIIEILEEQIKNAV